MRVLVTRAQPHADKTADALREAGHDPLVLPLFEVLDTGEPIPSSFFDGIIFTSVNAVEVLADRGVDEQLLAGKAYCVGEKTAAAAGQAGFTSVVAGSGDAAALAARIVAEAGDAPANLLYLAGRDRAYDMQGVLETYGHRVHVLELYEVTAIEPDPGLLTSLRHDLAGGVVLAYSDRTALHTAKVLFNRPSDPAKVGIRLAAISSGATQSVLKYSWQDVYVAEAPNEAALLKLVDQISATAAG